MLTEDLQVTSVIPKAKRALPPGTLCMRVNQAVGVWSPSEMTAGPELIVKGELGLWPKAGQTFGEGAHRPDTTNALVLIDWSFAISTFYLLSVKKV